MSAKASRLREDGRWTESDDKAPNDLGTAYEGFVLEDSALGKE